MTSDLQRELQQLPPESLTVPADLYDRVVTGVQRRRQRRAGLAAAGAILAVAATLVGVLSSSGSTGSTRLVPVGPVSGSTTPKVTPTPSSTTNAAPRFVPQSVSFVSADLGWAYGPVNAQNVQEPSFATPTQTTAPGVIAVTHDGGQSWRQLPAPSAPYTPGETVRFIDAHRGYLFGNALYTTADGGAHWQRLSTAGPVLDLRVTGGLVYILVDNCGVAPVCPPRELYTSPVGATTFTVATVEFQNSEAQLTTSGGVMYLLSPPLAGDGSAAVVSSSSDGVDWTQTSTPCLTAGADHAALAAFSAHGLALVCGAGPSAGVEPKTVYVSLDGGGHWTQRSTTSSLPAGGYVGPLAAADQHTWVMGERRGTLMVTHDSGRTWKAIGSTRPSVGTDSWVDVQFADPQHAAAVPGDLYSDAIVFSGDAGNTWSAHFFIPR